MKKMFFICILMIAFLMFTFMHPGPVKANPAGVAAAIAGGIILTAAVASAYSHSYTYRRAPGPPPRVYWRPLPPRPTSWKPSPPRPRRWTTCPPRSRSWRSHPYAPWAPPHP